jgi:CubicO group peptidase (beta-lactamase class C family)
MKHLSMILSSESKGRMRRLLAAAAVVLTFWVGTGGGCASVKAVHDEPVNGYADMTNRLNDFIQSWMADENVQGLSLVVVDGVKVVYAQGFGYAVRSEKRKVTTDTAFHVASVSKLFTAAAVMRLAEQGLLKLDDPVSRYLPEFKPLSRFTGSRPITVRDLLCHHSGLPSDYFQGYAFGPNPPADYAGRFLEIPRLASALEVVAPPGSFYVYSDIGYDVLGSIVVRVSGLSFEEYMRREILDPLGMSRSSFTAYEKLEPDLSCGYLNGKEAPVDYYGGIPETGLVSSARDLGRFLSMILGKGALDGKRIFKEETIREMLRPQNANVPLDFDLEVGLGFDLSRDDKLGGLRIASKDGSETPFTSYLLITPEKGLGVVVLANTDSAAVGPVAEQALRLALEAGHGLRAKNDVSPKNRKNTIDLSSYTGRYTSEIGICELSRGLTGFVLEIPWGRFNLVPDGGDKFLLQAKLFDLIPVTAPGIGGVSLRFVTVDGERLGVIYLNGQFIGIAVELKTHPVTASWRKRAGRYEIVNQDPVPYLEAFSIRYDRGRDLLFAVVTLKESDPLRLPLDPVSDDIILTAGKGRNLGETIRVIRENGKEYLTYSGFILRRISK